MRKNIYNIFDFGAVSDVEKLQTAKIQAAIDECFLSGGGEVVIPEGDYLTACIRLRSNVTLHLEKNAHLIGSKNARDYDVKEDGIEPYRDEDRTAAVWAPPQGYENVSNGSDNMVMSGKADILDNGDDFEFFNKPLSSWNNGIIKAIDAYDIAVICDDGAYIDGRDCFDETGEEHYRGPFAINMHRCNNIRFEGGHIKNSGNWAFALFDSRNVIVEKALVEAGHDGVHMTSCDNVTIRDCEFYCGDDCVAGIDNLNVVVKNCILNTACSAMRFGGTNALIEHCKAYGPAKFMFRGSLTDEEKRSGASAGSGHRHNMLGFFTYYSDYTREIRETPGNIKIKNCTVENADRFLHYNFSGNEPWQRNKPLASIEFENITATNVKHPITAYGDKTCPISLTIKNCNIHLSDDREILPLMYLCNAEMVDLSNTIVENFKNDVLIKRWDENGNIKTDGFVCENFSGECWVVAGESFVCEAI